MSHSHEDDDYCRAFVDELRRLCGERDAVWYDEHNLTSGELLTEIQHQLHQRPVFIVILTQASLHRSQWVADECAWVYQLYRAEPNRTILPVTGGPIERGDFIPSWLYLEGFRRIEAPGMQSLSPADSARRTYAALTSTQPSVAATPLSTPAATIPPPEVASPATPSAPTPPAKSLQSAQQKPIPHAPAVTDLYDVGQRRFLVHYSALSLGLFAAAGLLALSLVGFLGYSDPLEQWSFTYTVFHQPWPLYLWFCALIIALQASVLRHHALRRQRTMALTATIISMVIVGIIYFYNYDIAKFLQQVLNLNHVNLLQLGNNPWTYTIINFGVIIVFWLSTIRRWARRWKGLPLHAGTDIGLDDEYDDENPSLHHLVSGDLIAGAVLMLLLSLIFQEAIINLFARLLQTGVEANTCTLSLPGACHVGAVTGNPPSLLFIDLIQSLIYLPLGLIGTLLDVVLYCSVGGLLGALRAALNRRIYLGFLVTLGLRSVAWPVLILLGVVGAAAASRGIQTYLQLRSDNITCMFDGHWSAALCGGTTTLTAVQRQLNSFQQYQAAGLALIAGVGAVLAIVSSLALLLVQRHVALHTLQVSFFVFIRGFSRWWPISLALSGINGLVSLSGLSNRVPFPQPDLVAPISFISFVILVMIQLARSSTRPGSQGHGVSLDDSTP